MIPDSNTPLIIMYIIDISKYNLAGITYLNCINDYYETTFKLGNMHSLCECS